MKDNESLVVLEPIEYTVTVESAKALANEFSEVPDFDPSNGVKDEVNAQIIKDSKRLNKEISSIEKVRKRIVEPALNFQRTANALAKDLKSIIEPAKIRYSEARSKIDRYEQEQEQQRIDEERERVEAITAKIEAMRLMPLDYINLPAVDIKEGLDALEEPTEEVFEDQYRYACNIYVTAKEQLSNAYDTKQLAEAQAIENEKRNKEQREAEAKRDEELRIEREAMRAEREALDKEKAEMQAQKDAQAEAERRAKAEAEAEELALKQEQDARAKAIKDEATVKQREEETMFDIEFAVTGGFDGTIETVVTDILEAIIEDRIRNVKWEA